LGTICCRTFKSQTDFVAAFAFDLFHADQFSMFTASFTTLEKDMKNTLLAIALASAGMFAVPVLSHAAENNNGGWFINGNVGQSNLSKGLYDDSDTAYGVNVGYRWAINPNVALGIEGGYTDLGKFGIDLNQFVPHENPGLPNASVKGWTAGVNGHFNLTPQWYLSGRTGLFRADIKGAYANPDDTGHVLVPAFLTVDDTSTKYYAGAGFGYDFSNNLSVGLNYDYYKVKKNGLNLSPNLVSVSGEYRF
jgi:OOP family OmpA-OmpF porin/outer membrane immunogenic protein